MSYPLSTPAWRLDCSSQSPKLLKTFLSSQPRLPSLGAGPVYCKWFPAVGNGDGSTREPLDPPHCRVFFNASDILCLLDGKVDPETWFAAETSRARNVQWTTKGLGHEEETDDLEGYTSSICGCGDDDNEEEGVERCASDPERSQDADFRETEIQNGKEALELFRSASLVVGMHPDQAAGEAAQFAIARRLPWAVVPCCVYSRQFPKRRLRDGTPVTKYAHLVTWLRELHPRTRTAELPFEGRNTCIYMLPEDYS